MREGGARGWLGPSRMPTGASASTATCGRSMIVVKSGAAANNALGTPRVGASRASPVPCKRVASRRQRDAMSGNRCRCLGCWPRQADRALSSGTFPCPRRTGSLCLLPLSAIDCTPIGKPVPSCTGSLLGAGAAAGGQRQVGPAKIGPKTSAICPRPGRGGIGA